MRGRVYFCLLAILCLMLGPATLCAQSDRSGSARDFSLPIQPTELSPGPSVGPTGTRVRPPVTPRPIAPVRRAGTFGLTQLTQAAGTIFSGTVTAVVLRPVSRDQEIETVAVTFHVERAIRGVTPGEDFTISQWVGLWSSGQRYRVGERLLAFLYPTSKLGLTSCVGGAMGRFSVDLFGNILLSPQHLAAFHTDPVLAGKTRVAFGDFALAVRLAEAQQTAPREVEVGQ
jgi:hypothetical protein